VTSNLERKLEVLREKPVVIGGTYFEVVYAKDRLDDYKRWLRASGCSTSRSPTARSRSRASASSS
jgi:phosphosulfolactate synthase (CoM biosynthesis protein A)